MTQQGGTAQSHGPGIARMHIPETMLIHMDFHQLIHYCQEESKRYYQGQENETRYSYELFRRALVEHNDAAWEYLYRHYYGLVDRWVRRTSTFDQSNESSEYFVTGAFMKFWRAVTPERFSSFTGLAPLLHYLRLCTTSVVIDNVRSQMGPEIESADAISVDQLPQHMPDEEALQRVQGEEFWQFIDTQLNNEVERIVIYCSFVLGMTPRAILSRWDGMFPSVSAVYNVKRNVLGRLARNHRLHQLINAD